MKIAQSVENIISWIKSGEVRFLKFSGRLCGTPPRCAISGTRFVKAPLSVISLSGRILMSG